MESVISGQATYEKTYSLHDDVYLSGSSRVDSLRALLLFLRKKTEPSNMR